MGPPGGRGIRPIRNCLGNVQASRTPRPQGAIGLLAGTSFPRQGAGYQRRGRGASSVSLHRFGAPGSGEGNAAEVRWLKRATSASRLEIAALRFTCASPKLDPAQPSGTRGPAAWLRRVGQSRDCGGEPPRSTAPSSESADVAHARCTGVDAAFGVNVFERVRPRRATRTDGGVRRPGARRSPWRSVTASA